MEYQNYTNLLKSVLHLDKIENSFFGEISFQWDKFHLPIEMTIYKDKGDVELTTKIDKDNNHCPKLIQIRLYKLDPDVTEASFCRATSYTNLDLQTLNYAEYNSDKIHLSGLALTDRNFHLNYDSYESEHFQYSTIEEIRDIEFYHNLHHLYGHFNTIMPQYKGLSIQYNQDYTDFLTEEFREFITQKAWGLISLA